MKNKLLKYILFSITAMVLLSCNLINDTEKETEKEKQSELKTDNYSAIESDFTYSKGNKKIELVIENGAKYFELGKTTKLDFSLTNINNKRLLVKGKGLRVNTKDRDN